MKVSIIIIIFIIELVSRIVASVPAPDCFIEFYLYKAIRVIILLSMFMFHSKLGHESNLLLTSRV